MKIVSAHIFVKSVSIYVKSRPKRSSIHSTHIFEYISLAEMLRFCYNLFVCNYPGRGVCHSGHLTVQLLVLTDVEVETSTDVVCNRPHVCRYCIAMFLDCCEKRRSTDRRIATYLNFDSFSTISMYNGQCSGQRYEFGDVMQRMQ